MVFTHEEKVACLFTLMGITDSDGPRTSDENGLLARLSHNFGITTQELLNGMIGEAHRCGMSQAETILKPMSLAKKIVLEDAMTKIMELDEINDNKLGAWWGAQMTFELPEWISRKQK